MNIHIETYRFIENVYELAFGDDAINRDFTLTQVEARLREMLEDGHKAQEYLDQLGV